MLCEINASSITPFPPEAVPLLAGATAQAVSVAGPPGSSRQAAGYRAARPLAWAGRCGASTAWSSAPARGWGSACTSAPDS